MTKTSGIGLATKATLPTKATKATAPKASLPKVDSSAHYEAKNDMETLRSAEEIKLDPKRHGMARKMAAHHAQLLTNIGKIK